MNTHSIQRLPARKLLATTIAALTASALYVAPAYAAMELEEVIVSAQKKDDSLQDVPMTVNAVTADTIAKYKLLDFKDIQTVTPGLTISPVSNRTSTIAMRGVNVLTDSGYGPGVAIYWNEMNYDIDSAYKAMYDVGQIEVLRGPQGTLRGITAPAGAVTINTRQPSYDRVEGTAEQTFGERNLANSQMAVSLPLIEDKLALRLAGLYAHNQDSDIKNITTGKHDSELTSSGRMTLGFRATDNLEAMLTYQYMDTKSTGSGAVAGCGVGNVTACLGDFDRRAVDSGPDNNTGRREATVLRIDWDLGPYQVVSVTGYQDQYYLNNANQDFGNAWPTAPNELLAGQGIDVVPFTQKVWINQHIFTQEVRFSSNDADFYNWTYGLYGNSLTASTGVVQAQPLNLYDASFDFPLGYGSSVANVAIADRQEGYAAFTNQSFQLTDELLAQAGIRYQTSRTLNNQAAEGVEYANSAAYGHAVTGSASVSYDLTTDVRTYVSYGRSYRAGGFTPAPTSPQDITRYSPEYSDSIELGVKSRLFDGRVQLNADVYYQKYTDFLARTPENIRTVNYDPVTGEITSVGSDQLNYNADAVVQGAEMQLDVLLTDDWQAGLSLSYVDAKFTGGEAYCNVRDSAGIIVTPTDGAEVNTCTASGRVAGEPNWGLNLTTDYTLHFDAVDAFARGLYSFQSGRSDDFVANSALDTSSYGIFNVFFGVREKENQWEISVWAKNLFDHQQVTRRLAEASVGPTPVTFNGTAEFPNPDLTSGYSQIQIIPERQIGISGKYNFSF